MTPETVDPVEWIEKYFYIPETMSPLRLAPYQRDCIYEALSVGADGLLNYSTVLWGDIKKSIKSTIAAAVGLWWADTVDWSSIKVVANDLKQADSREAFYMRRAIELNRAYFERRGVKVTPSGYTIEIAASHSRIESVAMDPKGEAGGNDDLIIFTELWGAKGKTAEQMWTEMTLSPTKFGKSLRWIESYAGFSGESTILEGLHQAGVKDGAPIMEEYGPLAYRNEAARLFALWNETPRLPWQTPGYYAQEEAILMPSEFSRVHRNQWSTSSEAFVPEAWWNACYDPLIPVLGRDEPLVIALDAGVSSDCFAGVGTSRHHANDQHVSVRYVEKWQPPRGGKLEFSKPDDDVNYRTSRTPYARVLCMVEDFNVVEVAYDPYQLHDFATRLRYQGVNVREFSQASERLEADKRCQDMIRDRAMHHPNDATLTEAIKNANAKKENERLRIVKRADHLKIDPAVALSMSGDRCLRLNLA